MTALRNSPIAAPMTAPILSRPEMVTAFLIGAAIPTVVFGRALMQAVIALALIAVVALMAARRTRPALPKATDAATIAAAAIFIAWLPSIALSIDPALSALTWLRTLLCIGGGVLLAGFLNSEDRLRLCLKALVVTSLAGLTYAALAIGPFPEIVAGLRGGGGDSGMVALRAVRILKSSASMALCLMPVLLWAGWRLGGQWRWAGVTGILLSLILIEGTSSRSGVAGLIPAVLVVVALVFLRRHPKLLLPLVAVMSLCAAGGVWFIATRPPVVQGELVYHLPLWLIDRHRQVIWEFVGLRFLEAPWFGHGLNAINLIAGAHDIIPGIPHEFVPSHPHNWLIEIGAETGLVGLIPVLVLVVLTAWRDAAAYLRDGNGQALARLALWLAFWCAALFNFSIWAPWWQLTLIGLMAVVSARPSVRQ